MQKKGFSYFFTALIICLSLTFSACLKEKKVAKSSYKPRYKKTYNHNFNSNSKAKKWQPTKKHSIPFVMNSAVKSTVKQFNTRYRKSFERWIMRIGLYGPTIEKILKEEGVPIDLIYLSMIESGFNLSAESHASAVGPWQFIHSTGKMYGLKNDLFMDDRRNLIQSTRAAARHLKDLYKIYGDWYLAFGAYNAGPGTMNRAIRRTGSKNYWKLRHTRYLRPETKQYVPKVLAALHIVKNYKKYGYTMDSFGNPFDYDVAVVDDATDIGALAYSAETNTDTIAKLNPHLVSGVTRPDQKTLIFIPPGKKDNFDSKYSRIPDHKKVSHLNHKVQSGDTMKSVASFYGVNVRQLAKLNKKRTSSRLKTGSNLKIPTSKTVLKHLAQKSLIRKKRSKSSVNYYRVRKGDTLSRIARKHKTSVSRLAKWNRLKSRSTLRIGQRLKIYGKTRRYASRNVGRTFYAANFSNQRWSAPQLAKRSSKQKSRKMSGVSHIIFQTEQQSDNNETFAYNDESYENFDITQISATDGNFYSNNDDTPGLIKTGEEEAEEIVASLPVEKKSKAKKPTVHRVQAGESLSVIAQKYKISVSALKDYNGLKTNSLQVNQRLRLTRPRPQTTYHTVKAGESLSVIAQKYKMSVASLKKLNGFKSDFIKLNQRIKVKGRASNSSNFARKSQHRYHTVKSGESLSVIAQKHGLSIASLKQLNGLKTNQIRANQKLRLNSQTPRSYKNARPQYVVHRIQNGDTLWGLAKKYRVQVSQIKKWNKLSSNALQMNQRLKIYN